MDVIQYVDHIKPELLILIPVCWGIGMVLKATTLSNRWIPLILAVCNVVLASIWVLGEANLTNWQSVLLALFAAFTQGIFIWLVAWLSYEQGIKRLGIATERQGGEDL